MAGAAAPDNHRCSAVPGQWQRRPAIESYGRGALVRPGRSGCALLPWLALRRPTALLWLVLATFAVGPQWVFADSASPALLAWAMAAQMLPLLAALLANGARYVPSRALFLALGAYAFGNALIIPAGIPPLLCLAVMRTPSARRVRHVVDAVPVPGPRGRRDQPDALLVADGLCWYARPLGNISNVHPTSCQSVVLASGAQLFPASSLASTACSWLCGSKEMA
jgi:hypothetical protein